MKRIFLILLLLFGYAQAQNLPPYKPMLAGKTNEWEMKACFDGLNTHLFRFVCDANDTIIKNGKKYLQLREVNYADTVIAYVREDTLTRRVYVWNVKNHSQEVLTLDFSQNIGDTLIYPHTGGIDLIENPDGYKTFITDYTPIGKTTVVNINENGGVYGWGSSDYGLRRVFEYNSGYCIEEIGWYVGGFFFIADGMLAWSAQMMRRFRDGMIIFEAGQDNLGICAPLDFVPSRFVSCPYKFYPTLCDTKLNLEATKDGVFTFYQTNGIKVLEENFEIGEHTFSIETFPVGVYYARILSKNNQIFTQKIIKI